MAVRRQGKLRSFKAKMDNKAKKAGFLSGSVVAQNAQNLAPVLTGRLKRSIAATEPTEIKPGVYITLVGPTGLDQEIYPWVQEFGSFSNSVRPEKSVDPGRPGGVEPKLYMTNGLENSKQQILQIHKNIFK